MDKAFEMLDQTILKVKLKVKKWLETQSYPVRLSLYCLSFPAGVFLLVGILWTGFIVFIIGTMAVVGGIITLKEAATKEIICDGVAGVILTLTGTSMMILYFFL